MTISVSLLSIVQLNAEISVSTEFIKIELYKVTYAHHGSQRVVSLQLVPSLSTAEVLANV